LLIYFQVKITKSYYSFSETQSL